MSLSRPLKIIFAGTPEFAAIALTGLLNTEHEVIAVYTQPDRPAGRGRKLTSSAVKQVAKAQGIPVFQPHTLKEINEQEKLKALNADLMIVAAYGLLLPAAVLSAVPLGCINIHASLLPRWRGAAPIQRALLAGDQITGITIMQMEVGLDTGPMLKKVICPILSTDTTATLHDRLATLGAETIVSAVANLSQLYAEPQNNSAAIYAKKITKMEARLNWQLTATELECQVRAYNPWPVAFTDKFRVWEASIQPALSKERPGLIHKISAAGIEVITGKDMLRLEKIQFPGGKILAVNQILNARHDIVAGEVLI